MPTIADKSGENYAQEIPVSDLLLALRSAANYVRRKWVLILFISLGCGLLFFLYSVYKKPTYTAVCTFVLDESGSGSLGQYSSLAALAGINLGDAGGVFEGDNILELYTSRLMIEKTLLSPGNFNGRSQLLINHYLDFNGLREKWAGEDKLAYIHFNGDPVQFNRLQDSVITDLWNLIDRKNLVVAKPDKKLSIIRVEFSSKDELFAKIFTDQLVKNVNDFYVQTKIKKANQTIQVFQHEADSVKASLNSSLNSVALAGDANPNANPALQSLRVTAQKRQIDVQSTSAIYAEVVKNLEISKVSLRQELPLIQVIDKPVLPLDNDHAGKWNNLAAGAALGLLAAVFFLFTGKAYQSLLKQN